MPMFELRATYLQHGIVALSPVFFPGNLPIGITSCLRADGLDQAYLDVYLDVLKATMDELAGPFGEIRKEVEFKERQRWRPAKEVADWLRRVEAIKQEVDVILEEGERKSSLYCLVGLCPWNIWDSYMLGKRVDEKQTALDSLLSEATSIYRAVYGSGSPISDLVRYAERYSENADALLEEAREQGRQQPRMRRRWWLRGSS